MATAKQPGRTDRDDELPPVLEPGYTFASVTDKISSIVLTRRTRFGWLAGFAASFLLLNVLLLALGWLLLTGVGVWGNNIPVAWAFDIMHFVLWIGIGHAGTLVPEILLPLRPGRG